jgi:hypothetical protein
MAGGSVDVTGAEQRFTSLLFQFLRPTLLPWWFLPDPCRPTSMIRASPEGRVQSTGFTSQELNHLIVDNFYHLLCRGQASENFDSQGTFLDAFTKVSGSLIVHIGFQKCEADVA